MSFIRPCVFIISRMAGLCLVFPLARDPIAPFEFLEGSFVLDESWILIDYVFIDDFRFEFMFGYFFLFSVNVFDPMPVTVYIFIYLLVDIFIFEFTHETFIL